MNSDGIKKVHNPQVISTEQIDLLRRTICKGATEDELKMFLWQCQRTGLDPWSRQIYAVKRWDKKEGREVMAIQIAIDGFRLIAERTGKYAGQMGPYWCGNDGEWREVWLDALPPAAGENLVKLGQPSSALMSRFITWGLFKGCPSFTGLFATAAKVAVLRHDFKQPLWGVARFQTYAQTTKTGELTNFWRNMPEVMIAKVAEATALRRAFPMETSGLYTSEEMGAGAENVEVLESEPIAIALSTQNQPTLPPPTEVWRSWQTPTDALKWGATVLPDWTPAQLQQLFESLPAVNGKKAPAFVEKVLSMATTF